MLPRIWIPLPPAVPAPVEDALNSSLVDLRDVLPVAVRASNVRRHWQPMPAAREQIGLVPTDRALNARVVGIGAVEIPQVT